ncbi:MAG: hypothetical protein CMF74_08065 [Maricaulis sp.]|nr:hypothetical protein [Maricaulis sp.]
MSQPDARKDETEDFLEDILGFNFRSLRTLRDLLIRPRRVFETYAVRDRETYTPSLRLWLGIISIQVLFSVIWGGYGGILLSQWQSQPESTIASIETAMGGSIEAIAGYYGDVATLLHAIVVGGSTAFSAFLIGVFNKSLSWAARINITFGILTAASVIGLLMLIVAAITGTMAFLNWSIALIALIYWITFARGAPGILARSRTGAVLKGALFSFVTMLLVLLGGAVMAIIGFVYAAIRINGG